MATIYFIPVPIADDALHTLSKETLELTLSIKHFITENARTSRRMLKALHPQMDIQPILFEEIPKPGTWRATHLKEWLKAGNDVGVLSEAGMPGIADPGSVIATYAHQHNIKVKVIAGPNSMMMALAGSGLNGQLFAFRGYLPLPVNERAQAIRQMEKRAQMEKQSQIFMETPYRNNALIRDLLHHLMPATLLCVAFNLCGENEFLKTQPIHAWKKEKLSLPKAPAIFIIGVAR